MTGRLVELDAYRYRKWVRALRHILRHGRVIPRYMNGARA